MQSMKGDIISDPHGLRGTSIIKHFKKKQIVTHQGEIPRSILVVAEGLVRVYGISLNGEERVVDYLGPGDILSSEWVFDKCPVSLYYCSAATNLALYAVPKQVFLDRLGTDVVFRDAILNEYISKFVGSTIHVYALEHTRAQEKVVRILQYLLMRFGGKERGGKRMIELQLTHQDLAGLIGLSRETTAIEIGKLRTKGVLSYRSFCYTVDVQKLLAAIGENEYEDLELA